jgi:hypothetical protein
MTCAFDPIREFIMRNKVYKGVEARRSSHSAIPLPISHLIPFTTLQVKPQHSPAVIETTPQMNKLGYFYG